jgi:MFS family permease
MAPLIGPLIGGVIVSYASWHYIFALTGILGFIALCGLYRYTPTSTPQLKKLELKPILKHYVEIAKSKNYALGVSCTLMGAMPLLIWIGLAPNLILHHLQLSYKSYIIYQIIALGGLALSSILMQFLAGRWQFHQLIRRGCYLAFAGVLFSFIFSSSIELIALGLFFYSIGLGFTNGSIIRIIMSNTKLSQSMAASLMTFSQTLFFALGIQFSDELCKQFDYSGFSFTLCCLISACISLILTRKFAARMTERKWQ